MRERVPLFAGLTLLALAVGLGSAFIASGIRDRNRADVIAVTGSAKARIVSDSIVWDAALSSQDSSPAAAARQLTVWTTRVQSFFRDQGVAAAELTVQPISTETPGSY